MANSSILNHDDDFVAMMVVGGAAHSKWFCSSLASAKGVAELSSLPADREKF